MKLTKYVWVVLYLLWPVLWLTWRLLGRRDAARLPFLREAGHLAIVLLLSVYVINLGYGFERPFQPLERFEVGRRMLEKMQRHVPGGEQSWAADVGRTVAPLPVPFPENYIVGIDEILQHRATERSAYLRGRRQEGDSGTIIPTRCSSRCHWGRSRFAQVHA